MATDPFVVELFNLPHWAEYVSMAIFVIFVCGLSKWILNRQKTKCDTEATTDANGDAAVESARSDGGK